MLRSVDSSLCLEVVREHKWSVMCLHFGQSLFAEYFDVLPGANDMGQHDTIIRDSLETVEKLSRDEALSDTSVSLVHILPTHKVNVR